MTNTRSLSNRIQVERSLSHKSFSYPIVWQKGFDSLWMEISGLGLDPSGICIVSDRNVADLYLGELTAALSAHSKVCSHVFPAGEEHKNLSTLEGIYQTLIDRHFDRKGLLLALGGGVTGDLTGFAAATYMRGIDFIQIPTSLLAQVDSSVGGKTGVDFGLYKNMIGAFHQPRLVYMNQNLLKSLDEDQFASGMGEVLKTALLGDSSFYLWILDKKDQILARDPEIMSQIVRQCCQIKASIVEEDPNETGIRAILNLGHTLGHAVEKAMDFHMLHGHCVALGLVAAAWISWKRGCISRSDLDLIRRGNQIFHLPICLPDVRLSPRELVDISRHDKKMDPKGLKFILLRRLGEAVIDLTVGEEEMLDAARYILQEEEID